MLRRILLALTLTLTVGAAAPVHDLHADPGADARPERGRRRVAESHRRDVAGGPLAS